MLAIVYSVNFDKMLASKIVDNENKHSVYEDEISISEVACSLDVSESSLLNNLKRNSEGNIGNAITAGVILKPLEYYSFSKLILNRNSSARTARYMLYDKYGKQIDLRYNGKDSGYRALTLENYIYSCGTNIIRGEISSFFRDGCSTFAIGGFYIKRIEVFNIPKTLKM